MPDERIILCLKCGQQNRLDAKGRPDLARCGRCGEPLAPLPTSWRGAHGLGQTCLILGTATAVVAHLAYELHSKRPAPTRLSIEEVYGAAPGAAPRGSAVPVPGQKPRSTFADVSCELTARPDNGTVFLQLDQGRHELIIDNGTSADAVVELRNSQNADVASLYVRGLSTAQLSDVPEGTFEIFFATGHDYSRQCDRFMTDFTPWQFPGLHAFRSKTEGNLIYSTVMKFTLHEVIQGNISRKRIPDADWFNG